MKNRLDNYFLMMEQEPKYVSRILDLAVKPQPTTLIDYKLSKDGIVTIDLEKATTTLIGEFKELLGKTLDEILKEEGD